MNKFLDVVTLIIFGVMVANLVANPKGTAAVFTGASNLWSTSVNGMLGKTSG